MYSNSSLYYLNQLGIYPWVEKTANLEARETLPNEPIKVVLMAPISLSTNAQSLLKKVLDYLALSEKELVSLNTENELAMKKEIMDIHLKLNSSSIVFALGIDKALLSTLALDCSLRTSYSPEYLINNPISKKTLFLELNQIKHQVLALQ